MSRPARGLAFWAATGAAGVVALGLLNVAADKFGGGLATFRNFLVNRG